MGTKCAHLNESDCMIMKVIVVVNQKIFFLSPRQFSQGIVTLKYFAKFLAILLYNTLFPIFTSYFTLNNLILLLHIYCLSQILLSLFG